jgi:hypothetical protein
MTAKQISHIAKLASQAEKAAQLVERNRFLIENYISLDEARRGKVKEVKSQKLTLSVWVSNF